MQKKKLLESFPKLTKNKETPILSANFMKIQNDPSSMRPFQLFDRQILCYSNPQKKDVVHRITLQYDLIFQLLRGSTDDQKKKRVGTPYGLKFEKDEEILFLYSDNVQILKDWRNHLASKINQRGFHQLFKPIRKIGKGNFASVYLAIRKEDQKKFAIKAFSKQATYAQEKGKQSLVNQIELMRKFYHKNLMKLFQVYQSQNSIYVSVQLLEGGQLYDKIKNKHKFTDGEITSILIGLLSGLQHMHSKRIMHRDLKPQNILLRKQNDYDCVIADFGLATWADQPQYLFVRCGTPGYVAPEIVNIKDMKTKSEPICDIFSLGVIFHVLLTGKSPFPGKTYNQVLAQNRACNINFETQQCLKLSSTTLDLLKKMLEKNPSNRISATEALKHSYFLSNQAKNVNKTSVQCDNPYLQNISPTAKTASNKTSILKNLQNPSLLTNSPLMTTSNPFRKNNQPPLRDDSCLKFKMKQTLLTGKTQANESSDAIDSPNIRKGMMTMPIKQSRFGQQKKMLERKDMNRQQL